LLKSLFFLAATRVLFNFIPTGLFAWIPAVVANVLYWTALHDVRSVYH
jgi:hypothetical protein